MGNKQPRISIHQLTKKEQDDEKRKRNPNGHNRRNENNIDFTTVYFVTLTEYNPTKKKQFEVNCSSSTLRWFLCPYNNTMEQLLGGTEELTPERLTKLIEDNFGRIFNQN